MYLIYTYINAQSMPTLKVAVHLNLKYHFSTSILVDKAWNIKEFNRRNVYFTFSLWTEQKHLTVT